MTQFIDNFQNTLDGSPLPRTITIEKLSPDEIALITETVFVEPAPHAADLLFIFGTTYFDVEILDRLANYWRQGYFPNIIVTGLKGHAPYKNGKPLAHVMHDELVARGISSDLILMQDRSTNTLEDVTFSLEILDKHHVYPQSIAYLSKAHHSGRCLRTLRKYFVSQTLWAITYEPEYDGIRVCRENWHQHPVSRGRVVGEYLRIIRYTNKGDIAQL